ncbi:hypothetical protein HS048_20340 [Planomonospora sp. ID91781]|uniref:hypothetical protein n=1 Tax=Planomonospora sp. ID91781 TaxID=2738135 RepID=UPI0018C3E477|nr:hypothetical protein [Planomonospora sp. ID91781]MBG0823087.1 hypothetical protein [Planomonospora sp. ID91781]
MKFRLVDAENDHHDVSLLARVLGVSRQGYYTWRRRQERGPSARAHRDAETPGAGIRPTASSARPSTSADTRSRTSIKTAMLPRSGKL